MAVPLGKIAGIPIYLDYSWFVIFFLIVWTISYSLMPSVFPGLSPFYSLIIGVVTALLFFASLLVHELAHCIVARRNGLRIRRITLFLLGGVSDMEDEPTNASVELRMAAVGPLTSLAIALLFGAIWLFSEYLALSPLIQAPLFYLALVNLLMAGFNFIPAFPMDGGRVLRSLLWKRNGDLVRATEEASTAGRAIAWVIIFVGVFFLFFIDLISGIWFVLIGWFISSSSSASLRQTMIEEDLRGVKAADLMTRNVDSVTPDMTLQELSEEFLRTKHTGFPVTANGQLEGCVTMHDLRRFGREKWATIRVRDAMTPKDKLVTACAEDPAMTVLSSMQRGSIGRIFVMDGDRVSGIITRSDVVKALELREGTLGISRGKAAIEGKASMTAEIGMRFVLEQPVEENFTWRAEFSGDAVQLVGQDTVKSPTGEDLQRLTFQANKPGICVIRLQEVTGLTGTGGGGSKRVLRTVTYTVTVSPPSRVSI